MNKTLAHRIASSVKLLAGALLLLCLYVLSIVWRVSAAENQYFGRSELIPMSFPVRKFDEAPVAQSYGHKTYVFDGPCGRVIVFRQKINGFQHMYGSALACSELGEFLSDKLFCLNEFAEYLCDWNGVEPSDLLDRKKDLANNALGRSIAIQLKNNLAENCAIATENNPAFLAHYLDPRVSSLTESKLGCAGLPKNNVFNYLRKSVNLE